MLSSAAIIDRITKVPTKPADALFSRRRHPEVEIGGDALVLPIENNTTNPLFVQAIKNAQNAIFQQIEEDSGLLYKKWDTKTQRHQEKNFKRHKKLHFSFLGTIPIGTKASHDEIAKKRTKEQIIEAQQVVNEFVKQEIAISGYVKECIWNPDGHLVVKVDIDPAHMLFDCKAKLTKIFGGSYNRYSDLERQKTLGSVIGVIDPEKISPSTKIKIDHILKQLEIDLKSIKPLFFTSVEWIVYDKRTLSNNSRLFVWSCDRNNNFTHFIPEHVHPASLPYSEEMKIIDQNNDYHPAAWRRSY